MRRSRGRPRKAGVIRNARGRVVGEGPTPEAARKALALAGVTEADQAGDGQLIRLWSQHRPAIAVETPVDALHHQHRRDAALGVAKQHRHGLTGAQAAAGRRLAQVAVILFGRSQVPVEGVWCGLGANARRGVMDPADVDQRAEEARRAWLEAERAVLLQGGGHAGWALARRVAVYRVMPRDAELTVLRLALDSLALAFGFATPEAANTDQPAILAAE